MIAIATDTLSPSDAARQNGLLEYLRVRCLESTGRAKLHITDEEFARWLCDPAFLKRYEHALANREKNSLARLVHRQLATERSRRRERFVDHYALHYNAIKAMLAAGYKPGRKLFGLAHSILREPWAQERLAEVRKREPERIRDVYREMAFGQDITAFAPVLDGSITFGEAKAAGLPTHLIKRCKEHQWYEPAGKGAEPIKHVVREIEFYDMPHAVDALNEKAAAAQQHLHIHTGMEERLRQLQERVEAEAETLDVPVVSTFGQPALEGGNATGQ